MYHRNLRLGQETKYGYLEQIYYGDPLATCFLLLAFGGKARSSCPGSWRQPKARIHPKYCTRLFASGEWDPPAPMFGAAIRSVSWNTFLVSAVGSHLSVA